MNTLCAWDTELSADSVEWCPVSPHVYTFVCGTYHLSEQQRLGRLYLFVKEESLRLLQTLEMPGILDMKWCQHKIDDKVLLAVASSTGEVHIYELQEDGCKLSLLCKHSINNTSSDGDLLALSLDWSRESLPQIVVSDSRGCVTVLQLNAAQLQEVAHWRAHDHEAWICAFNYSCPFIVFSGGDDSKLLVHDMRRGTARPVVCKVHTAGVTSLHHNSSREHILASGSYDEKLRIWDARNMSQEMSSINLGGGVWRLKWDPFKQTHLLAACMHNGFCIVHFSEDTLVEKMRYSGEHTSLAYGADWCVSSLVPRLVATCSFYDHKLCIADVSETW